MTKSTVPLSDGWSFVTRGSKKQQSAVREATLNRGREKPADEAEASKIARDIEHARGEFSTNPRRLAGLASATAARPITHAFCLGLGSLSSGTMEQRKRARAQLVGFTWLMGSVDRNFDGEGGGCLQFAIDPSFTRTDDLVLEKLVPPIQAACEASKEHHDAVDGSLVYAPYLPWPVLLLDYLDDFARKPKVLICQDVRAIRENLELRHDRMRADEIIEVDGRRCTKKDVDDAIGTCYVIPKAYKTVEMPIFESMPEAFQGMVMYIRLPLVDDTS